MTNVSKRLEKLVKIHKDRSGLYGEDYKQLGVVMAVLFPEGITLGTPEEHTRFALFLRVVGKICRYAAQYPKGHQDSLDDLSVYAQILGSVDEEDLT